MANTETKKSWVASHKRASMALLGCFLIWLGLISFNLPWGLVISGAGLLSGVLLSYLPDPSEPPTQKL